MSGATAGLTGICCSNEKYRSLVDFIPSPPSFFKNGEIAIFGPRDDNSCNIIKLPKNQKVILLSDTYYSDLKKIQSDYSDLKKIQSATPSQTYYIIIGVLGVLLLLFIILTIVGFVKK